MPYLDGLTSAPGGDAEDLMGMLMARFVDVAVVPPGVESDYETPDGVDIQLAQSSLVEQLTFQFGESRDRINPVSNNDERDYREAIAYSIDREAIIQATGVPWDPRTPGMLVATGASAWDIYPYDPSTGSELIEALSGSGESESKSPEAVLSTTSELDDRIRIGDALVGIDLDTVYLESLIFFGEQLGTGVFDIGMWAWSSNGGYGDQLTLMERFDSESGTNLGNWGAGESASAGSATYSELVV